MNAYQYRCYVTSTCTSSTATSNAATLTISVTCSPVAIAIQPQNQSVNPESSATFNVSVSGDGPFSYFWYKNGVSQTSTTGSSIFSNTYTTPILNANNNGDYYYCLITNCNNTYQAQSNSVILTINKFSSPTVVVTSPLSPVKTVFAIGLKFSVPVLNVLNGITVIGGKLEDISGSGDTYVLTISAKEQTTVSVVLSDAIKDLSSSGNKFVGQTLTYITGDFTNPQCVSWSPLDETISTNHPIFKMSFDENITFGYGGALKVYKVGSAVPVLTIPITSSMINGKDITVAYSPTQAGLDKNTRYYVLIDKNAINDNAGNSFSGVSDVAAWTFKTSPFATSVDPLTNQTFNYKVYPNPTTGIITIEGLTENHKTRIAIYTADGKLIMKKISYASLDKIDISNIVPGTYILTINKITIKIIKE
jgi:hypothetical protein